MESSPLFSTPKPEDQERAPQFADKRARRLGVRPRRDRPFADRGSTRSTSPRRASPPSSPATASASSSWQAVTPEPHIAISLSGRATAEKLGELAAQRVRRAEAPVGLDVDRDGPIHGARHVAGDRIDRLLLAAVASGARASTSTLPAAWSAGSSAASTTESSATLRGTKRAGRQRGARLSTGSPAALHAAKPPSSTSRRVVAAASRAATTAAPRSRRSPRHRQRPSSRSRCPRRRAARRNQPRPAADAGRRPGPGRRARSCVEVSRSARPGCASARTPRGRPRDRST